MIEMQEIRIEQARGGGISSLNQDKVVGRRDGRWGVGQLSGNPCNKSSARVAKCGTCVPNRMGTRKIH